jgi:hypothetical protein
MGIANVKLPLWDNWSLVRESLLIRDLPFPLDYPSPECYTSIALMGQTGWVLLSCVAE